MQCSLDGDQEGNGSYDIAQLKIWCNNKVYVEHCTSGCIALEISCVDIPGIFFEVTTVLFELSCMVGAGEVWTHNGCTAGIPNRLIRDHIEPPKQQIIEYKLHLL
ncbi:hypothetical protein MA16_Dca000516 [Dendrobium catenatum]|uniref:Uncharacterized protein n=1 Tax=Dendrobium catenatum TaxID=906689 RepID=A0A2I0WU27_9ASPA|nr:hypothetical protein MA16_Dca000516 [Dendrobium catenatum]